MSTLKTYPKIYYRDGNGKHPIHFIQVYGVKYEFKYGKDGEIILEKVNNSDVRINMTTEG